jgi:glucose uptake protein GlcU
MIVVIAIVTGIVFMRRGKSKKPPKEWKEPPEP